eukprot:2113803-Amphidinium_carterae.2
MKVAESDQMPKELIRSRCWRCPSGRSSDSPRPVRAHVQSFGSLVSGSPGTVAVPLNVRGLQWLGVLLLDAGACAVHKRVTKVGRWLQCRPLGGFLPKVSAVRCLRSVLPEPSGLSDLLSMTQGPSPSGWTGRQIVETCCEVVLDVTMPGNPALQVQTQGICKSVVCCSTGPMLSSGPTGASGWPWQRRPVKKGRQKCVPWLGSGCGRKEQERY